MMPLLNQIQRWLKHPKVCRFTGFASAVVGLLCYALSSSFNSLFGEWKLWKILLYCVFSFIICTAVLLAKSWHHSSSVRFKAHIAFLVLTITSFYSAFFDKHANGKPDAYNLVSCAAFAVMSLSLSRQTHFGYEVELLYFFLGALIVQLIKIQWLFGIVGTVFSYSLVTIRSHLDAHPEANGYSAPQSQPQVNIQVDSLPLLSSLDALKKMNPRLLRLVHKYRYDDLGNKLFQPDINLFIDALPSEIINNLNEAMKLAVAAGSEDEFCRLYSTCRKEFLLECLSALNLPFSINNENHNDIGMTKSIIGWTRASKTVVKIVMPNEQRLCNRVFLGLSSVGNLTFKQICKEPTITLLNFPKTFKVDSNIGGQLLRVLEALLDIIHKLESFFPDQDYVSLSNEAITICKKLGDENWYSFKNIENLICSDTRIASIPGGIHLIAFDVMMYLAKIIELKPEIERLWREYPIASNIWGAPPQFFVQIASIMEFLESHLEAKSKNYREPSLYYVSMMNHAMLMKEVLEKYAWFANSENTDNLRLHNIEKYSTKVEQNLEDYRRSTWEEVLRLLKLESKEESVALGVVAESMKEKLQLFNIQFEQICNIQSKWFGRYDTRYEIIKLLENLVMPAYGNFIGRFLDVHGKHANEYIQFGIDDINDRLNNMFQGGKVLGS